jgi:hypothetical protein
MLRLTLSQTLHCLVICQKTHAKRRKSLLMASTLAAWPVYMKHLQRQKMPRPKPPEPLKGRQIRLTDRHMMIFQELGGIDWLRKQLDKNAKMPAKYYRLELDAPSKKEIND